MYFDFRNGGLFIKIREWGILSILVFVIFISGCTSNNSSHPEAQNVTILNSSGAYHGSSWYVDGELQNNNPFGVAYVKVNITGYDEKGNVVGSNYAYADIKHIPSGGKSTFSSYVKDTNFKIVRYDVKVIDADKSIYNPSEPTSSSSSSSSSSKFPLVPTEKVSCPQCGSFDNVVISEEPYAGKYIDTFACNNCGKHWTETFSTPAK